MRLPQTACIIVGTNGFVWYTPQVTDCSEYIYLKDAQIIRVWGTTHGLAQLIDGPTKDTVLDTKSEVVLNKTAFIYAIPCKKWDR